MRTTWLVSLILASGAVSAPHAWAGELEGRWRNGSWTDDNTGHEGPLRARFRATANGNYRVVFTGRFAKIVPFRFATTLIVVERDESKVVMAGESRIMGFWRFNYHAVADEHNFIAQYSSSRWRGEFNLQR
jgi:hypothetical protein